MRGFWTRTVVGCLGFLFACQPLFAEIIEIRANYAARQDIGYYGAGKFGQAIGLSGRGPVYPAQFDRFNVEAGAISFWFKPTRQIFSTFAGRELLDFSDGSQRVKVFIGREQIKNQYCDWSSREHHLIVAESSFAEARLSLRLEDQWTERFHHFLYTWDRDQIDIYFDGKKVKTARRQAGKAWLQPFNGDKIAVATSGICSWLDELIVLKRRVEEKEADSFYKAVAPWRVDEDTALYAPFDNSVAGKGAIGQGDLVSFSARLGVPDGMFRAGDKPEMIVTVKNASLKSGNARLETRVKDFQRETVMTNAVSVPLKPLGATDVVIDFSRIPRKGPFYAYLELKENGHVSRKERVPFAITLGVDIADYAPEDIYSGLVTSNTYNPPIYDKWDRITYEANWNNLELERDHWYWDRLDLKVNEKLATGRTPVITLGFPPTWRRSTNPKHLCVNTGDLAGWKDYAARVARRYKGKVYNYMCIGEAYCKCHVGALTVNDYATAINAIAEVTRTIDPAINTVCDIGGGWNWDDTVAHMTAGKASYYAIHPYAFACGGGLTAKNIIDAEDVETSVIGPLKRNKASASLADTEIGCYTLMGFGVDTEGFPLSEREFNQRGVWENMPKVFKERGRDAFVDWLTGSFRVVRVFILDRALGCRYTMWWNNEGGSGFSDLQWAPYTPSPESVAFANLSGLTAGKKYRGRIDMGGKKDLKCYAFSGRGEIFIAAWTDGKAADILLKLENDKFAITDQYGNPYPYIAKDGTVKIKLVPLQAVLVYGKAENIPEAPQVLNLSIPNMEYFGGNPAKITIGVYNPLGQALAGTVDIALPKDFAPIPSQSVELKPLEKKEYAYWLTLPVSNRACHRIEAFFKTNSDYLGTFSRSGDISIVKGVVSTPTTTPIAIDGNLNDWKDLPIKIDTEQQLLKGNPYTKTYVNVGGKIVIDWKGKDDLSAEAATRYDKENLYIAVKVKDDMLANEFYRNDMAWAYQGDSVELFLDGRADNELGTNKFLGKVFHLKIVPPLYGESVAWTIAKKSRDTLEGLRVASQTSRDGYSVEVSVPWKNFPDLTPTAGQKLGMDIYVNDDHEERLTPKDSKSTLSWTGRQGGSQNPSKFGRIVLGEK